MGDSTHYAMYRKSSLGTSLQWTLQEMVDSDSISKDLMDITLLQFDKVRAGVLHSIQPEKLLLRVPEHCDTAVNVHKIG